MKSFHDQLISFFDGFHRLELTNPEFTRAAVLVPIFEEDGNPHFLLTKRTEDVEHHKGQISFPGGAVDKIDQDIVATALRETEEEIGLIRDDVEIIGIFNDITIPTGFVVTPVVGYLSSLPPFKLSRNEVESVIEVPFSFFREPKNKRIVNMVRDGKPRAVYFFRFEEHEIWGATAFIIESLLNQLPPAF